jgi:hypothetical protein
VPGDEWKNGLGNVPAESLNLLQDDQKVALSPLMLPANLLDLV